MPIKYIANIQFLLRWPIKFQYSTEEDSASSPDFRTTIASNIIQLPIQFCLNSVFFINTIAYLYVN